MEQSTMEKDIIERLASGTTTYRSFEAVPQPGNRIAVPNFHYLVYRRPQDQVWVGYCIDFDILAYSRDTDARRAEDKLFARLCNMVKLYIATLIKTDTLETLYDNANWGFAPGSFGAVYNTKYQEQKMAALRDSLKRYLVEISNETDDLTVNDDETLENLYNSLKEKREELVLIQKKIADRLSDKGSNVVSFIPRVDRAA